MVQNLESPRLSGRVDSTGNGPAKKEAEKTITRGHSVSYFSGANFSNQIKSEC